MRRPGSWWQFAGVVGLISYLLWVMGPIVWLVITSLKSGADQFHRPPLFLFKPTFVNYLGLFGSGYQQEIGTDRVNLAKLFYNSLVTSLLSTACAMLIAIPGAYVMARFRFRINVYLLAFMLFTRMLPPMSLALPMYLIGRQVGLYDSLALLIIVYTAVNVPFDQYLMIGFFRAVPVEIEEAGLIDGLTRMGCLRRILLPVVLPGLAATAILTLWTTWTDYQFALVLTSSEATTAPVGIAGLVSQYGQLWGLFGAAGVTYSVPVVAFCLVAQRYLVSGLTMGSLK